jgi:hypothetical protein
MTPRDVPGDETWRNPPADWLFELGHPKSQTPPGGAAVTDGQVRLKGADSTSNSAVDRRPPRTSARYPFRSCPPRCQPTPRPSRSTTSAARRVPNALPDRPEPVDRSKGMCNLTQTSES